MRRVLSFSGPGFSSNKGIAEEHPDKDLEIIERSILFDSSQEIMQAFLSLSPEDFMFLRAPLHLTSEDLLLSRIAYLKMSEVLKVYVSMKAQDRPTLFALGRGALPLLEVLAESEFRSWKWHDHYSRLAPFTEVSMFLKDGREARVYGAFSGISVSLPQESIFSDWETWVKIHEEVVGWRLENCYLSLVDVFGLKRLSQLDDYGYREMKSLTGIQALEEYL
ncbi:hypothetical protein GW915_09870 [bacterium]|nr:hypothetical protein [bacterium]